VITTQKRNLAIITALLAVSFIIGFIVANISVAEKDLTFTGGASLDFETEKYNLPYEVHTRIIVDKAGETVLDEYHAGVVTNLGLNLTFCKLFGNTTSYNTTQYMYNLTHVGIGNQGALSAASVVLPGEWNRTVADTQHDLAYNTGNWTLVIEPDNGGPYTADCLGVYFHASEDTLFLYDTFTEVSGIDETFTITLEIILSATGS